MAEQSSTVATFRALVMLICVILIPVAALCGTSFPAVVKAIQNGRCPTLADFRGTSDAPPRAASEAPLYAQPVRPAGKALPYPSSSGASSTAPLYAPPSQTAASSQVVPAGFNDPIGPERPVAERLSTTFPQNRTSGGEENRQLSPPPSIEGNLALAEHGGASGYSETRAAPAGGSGEPLPSELFKQIPEQLRKLGATYYLLEFWGDQKQEFRFYCKMAIGGNTQITKPFQCIDSDPVKAMTQVLKQVETWRNGVSDVQALSTPERILR